MRCLAVTPIPKTWRRRDDAMKPTETHCRNNYICRAATVFTSKNIYLSFGLSNVTLQIGDE